jgi:RhoGEF domain
MRYKIINEIVQTENTFLQDMIVLEEGYNAFCHECPLITARQKQTMFSRTKNVIIFSNSFYKGLSSSAGVYLDRREDEITEVSHDKLVQWDSETSIGDVFWSSV